MSLHCESIDLRRHGRPVLRGCSLTQPAGSHWVLAGPSGAGKSTLLRIIAGLEAPCAGRISWGGRLLSADGSIIVPPRDRGAGMMFQDLGLWSNVTVTEHLKMVLRHLRRRERCERVASMLEACGLSELSHKRPDQLSGGEQQRLALARALSPNPRLLLLDEPFAGMDTTLRGHFCKLLNRLRVESSLTLITVTHQLDDVLRLGPDLVAVLEDGSIKETFKVCEVRSPQPQSSTRAAWRDDSLLWTCLGPPGTASTDRLHS